MSDSRCHIEIQVLLDTKPWAIFHWPAVPRIGDLITLKDSSKRFESRVVMVVWGERSRTGLDTPLAYVHTEGRLNKEK